MIAQEGWTDCDEEDETHGAAEHNDNHEVNILVRSRRSRSLSLDQGGQTRQPDPGLSGKDEEEEN